MTRNILSIAMAAVVLGCGGGDGGSGTPSGPVVTATGSVRGTVKDNLGVAVSAVSVQLSATGKPTLTATSGTDGVFTITNVVVGTWQLAATLPTGFANATGPTVTVSANQQTSADIVLTRQVVVEPPLNADVSISNFAFSPKDVTIKQNGSIQWKNNDAAAHTATGASFDSGVLQSAAMFTQAFATKGTFNYRCTIHAGMTGTVTVQ